MGVCPGLRLLIAGGQGLLLGQPRLKLTGEVQWSFQVDPKSEE